MLSTPPAFILSQDQTLMLKFQSGQNNTRLFIPFTVLGCWIFFNVRLSFSKDSENLIWIFKDLWLFSFQCSILFFWNSFYILSRSFSFVKKFFQLFSTVFSVVICDSFYILSKPFPFVKNFLFFICIILQQLLYLIISRCDCQYPFKVKNRRRRDLNPRAARTTYTLSRGASSATWVLLQAN